MIIQIPDWIGVSFSRNMNNIESQAGVGDRSTTSLDCILLQAKGTDRLSVGSSSVSSYQGPNVGSEDQSKQHPRKSISPSNVQFQYEKHEALYSSL